MKQLKWYFKHGTKSETYSVIYEDDTFMLVRNENSGKYSFGAKNCFGTLYGFPVNWSCLTKEKAIETLTAFCDITTTSTTHQTVWKGMLNALTAI